MKTIGDACKFTDLPRHQSRSYCLNAKGRHSILNSLLLQTICNYMYKLAYRIF